MKSFTIMPYSEPYETIYENLVKPCLSDLGFEIYRADQMGYGKPILDIVTEGIRAADLVIILNDPGNGNVLLELGQAQILKKELILLIRKEDVDDLPTDINNLSHLIVDIDKLHKSKKPFLGALKGTDSYLNLEKKKQKKVLTRGDTLPNLADAVIYLEPQQIPLKERIINQIGDGKTLDFRFLYEPDVGAIRWLDLCSDATYYFNRSVSLFQEATNKIIEEIGEEFLSQSPDYVSLGCGDGQKDAIFLNGIAKSFEDSLRYFYYYPCDISINMLSQAIMRAKSYKQLEGRLLIKAFQGDFNNLQSFKPVYDFREEKNIFAILGNTLGNTANEGDFFANIYGAMNHGDYLIVEIRLYFENGDIHAGGTEDKRKKFNTSPLQYINAEFEEDDIEYVTRSLSPIKNTLSLDCICKKMSMGDRVYKNLHLGVINHYNETDFEEYIKNETDFDVELKIIQKEIKSGIFLLKKAEV